MRGIRFLLAAALPLAGACAGPQSRIRGAPERFASYPADVQEKIRAGQVDLGFDQDMVWMALGKPRRRFTRTTQEGIREVWVYGRGGRSGPGVGFSIGGATGGGGGIYGGGVSVGSGGGSYGDELRVVFQGGRVVAVETDSGP